MDDYQEFLKSKQLVVRESGFNLDPREIHRIPDSFILPDNKQLACKGIGNGVPCLMMEKIYKQLMSIF